jgi:hypothetical protein
MPVYTIINKTSQEHDEVFCSWSELQEMLKDDNLIQELAIPKIVHDTGSLLARTDNGWKDNLSRIKAGSGKNNTIKT